MERAQSNAAFHDKAYKIAEEEKKDDEIHAPDNKDSGLYSKEEFIKFELNKKEKVLEAEAKCYIRAMKKELEQKPISRDQNGNPIGRGSFWQRKPYAYSTTGLNLDQDHPNHIHYQDLTFTD